MPLVLAALVALQALLDPSVCVAVTVSRDLAGLTEVKEQLETPGSKARLVTLAPLGPAVQQEALALPARKVSALKTVLSDCVATRA